MPFDGRLPLLDSCTEKRSLDSILYPYDNVRTEHELDWKATEAQEVQAACQRYQETMDASEESVQQLCQE